MRTSHLFASASAALLLTASVSLFGQQAPAAPAAPAAPGGQSAQPGPPTFFPPAFIGNPIAPPPVTVPAGFTPIFNGTSLAGWHVSRTSHHGRTPDFFVLHGAIVATQNPLGGGGILLTDKKYKDFELSMEVKPDWGCDSGIFLRSTESGAAYQVTMDFLSNGSMGSVIGEGGMQLAGRAAGAGRAGAAAPAGAQAGRAAGAAPAGAAAAAAAGRQGGAAAAPAGPPPGFGEGNQATAAWLKAWKRDQWNLVRVRMEGEIPRVQVWINDQLITDFKDTANSAIGGAYEAPIAIQVHGAGRWVQGGFWRWRNIGIREL